MFRLRRRPVRPRRAPGAAGAAPGRRACAFAPLPIPFFGADAGDIPALQVLAGVLAVALLVALVCGWRAARGRKRAEAELQLAAADLARIEAANTVAPGSFWAWPANPGADVPTASLPGSGGKVLAGAIGAETTRLATFDDVLACFLGDGARRLEAAVDSLRNEGVHFTLTLAGVDGERVVEAEGARLAPTAGTLGFDVVWFRDATAEVGKVAAANRRAEALIGQIADYRNALDLAGLPVWVRGPGLDLVYCNQAYAAAVEEESPAAAVAAQAEIAGGPAGWGRELADQALETGEPATRASHVVAGGARKYMEVTELPIGGPDSSWWVLGVAVDRSQAEEARTDLKRHVMAHGEVLESLGTGIVIFGPDTRVQFANTAFARMWGADEDWLKTEPTHGELLEDLRARRVYPDQPDFQEFKRGVMELYTSPLIDPMEELLYLPDERVFRTVVNAHPLGGLLVTYEDVTDRLAMERSYNTLIAVQSETLDNLHEGVVVFGSDGRLRLSNPGYARIWNLDAQSLRGEPRLADIIDRVKDLFVYDGPWDGFREKILAGALDRTPRTGRFERTDGSVVDYAAVPLPDGAMMFSYIDVTDTVSVQRALAERNEALLAADRLKSEFITNVSYELRTPLNTIIGFTEILLNQYFGELNERQQDYAANILQSSQILLSLIDNILDLALIDAGRLELERGEIEICDMLNAVADLVRAQKQTAGIEVDCPADIGTVNGDERRLKQALANLVINAVTYSPPGGTVAIRAWRQGGAVDFEVSDQGPGIPEEDHDRVLNRFETGQGGAERGKGLGLGLALVKNFVEAHGGQLRLSSAPGEGTTVSFDVPAAPGAADVQPAGRDQAG